MSSALLLRAELLASTSTSSDGNKALDLLLLAQRIDARTSSEQLRSLYEEAQKIAPAKANTLLPAASTIAFDAADRPALLSMLRLYIAAAAYAAAMPSDEPALLAPLSPVPVVLQALQSSAIVGKPYEMRIMLATPAKHNQAKISVNGAAMPIENGATQWKKSPTSAGVQSYEVNANVENPMTGENINAKATFAFVATANKAAASTGSAALNTEGLPPTLLALCTQQEQSIASMQTLAAKPATDEYQKVAFEFFSKHSAPILPALAAFNKSSAAWQQGTPDERQYKEWQQTHNDLSEALQTALVQLINKNLASHYKAVENQLRALSPLPDFAAFSSDKKQALAALLLARSEMLQTVEALYCTFLERRLDMRFDNFVLFATPKSPSVAVGEAFESQIQLGAYSNKVQFSATVDGKALPVVNGIATYTFTPTDASARSITVKIQLTNPLTGESYQTTKKVLIPVVAQ